MEDLRTEIQNAITLFWEEDSEEKATSIIIEIAKKYSKKQLISFSEFVVKDVPIERHEEVVEYFLNK